MWPEVTVRALVERSRHLVWWAVGGLVYVLAIGIWWPSVRDSAGLHRSVDNYPLEVKALFGGEDLFDVSHAAGFLHIQLFALVVPLALAIFAIGFAAHSLAGEEEDGQLDLLLSYPLSRRRALLEKAGAIFASILGLGLVGWLTLLGVDAVSDLGIGSGAFLAAVVGVVLLSVFHATVTLLGAALTGERRLAVVSGVLAVGVGYGLMLVAQLDGAGWLKYVSPYYYGTGTGPLTGSWPVGPHVALVLFTGAALAGAVVAFERRNIGT